MSTLLRSNDHKHPETIRRRGSGQFRLKPRHPFLDIMWYFWEFLRRYDWEISSISASCVAVSGRYFGQESSFMPLEISDGFGQLPYSSVRDFIRKKLDSDEFRTFQEQSKRKDYNIRLRIKCTSSDKKLVAWVDIETVSISTPEISTNVEYQIGCPEGKMMSTNSLELVIAKELVYAKQQEMEKALDDLSQDAVLSKASFLERMSQKLSELWDRFLIRIGSF